jgi:hypothetical protein
MQHPFNLKFERIPNIEIQYQPIKSALQRRNAPRNKRDGSSEGRENVTMSLKKDNLSK